MFTPDGASLLASALPELQAGELQLRPRAEALGIRYRIASVVRTEAEQATLLATREAKIRTARTSGYTSAAGRQYPPGEPAATAASLELLAVAPVGLSFHHYGAAFDLNVTDYPTARFTLEGAYRALADVTPGTGLRPGYYFQKPDRVHWELPVARETAKSRWLAFAQGPGLAVLLGLVGLAVMAYLVGAYLLEQRALGA
jgi:hypothetical protein